MLLLNKYKQIYTHVELKRECDGVMDENMKCRILNTVENTHIKENSMYKI